MRKKRLTRRMPESSRKRKLGGNSRDHRPYFTYWVTFVQVAVLFISLLLYGFGPIGVDLYKRQNMVSGGMRECRLDGVVLGASDQPLSGEHRIPGARQLLDRTLSGEC